MEDSTKDRDEAYLFKRVRYEVEASLQHQLDDELKQLKIGAEKLHKRSTLLTYLSAFLIFVSFMLSMGVFLLNARYTEVKEQLDSHAKHKIVDTHTEKNE